jgi:hypothetical protein
VGLTHNLGLGGAVVVSVYRMPEAWKAVPKKRPVSGGQGESWVLLFSMPPVVTIGFWWQWW